ncbi:hypothetical protein FD755_011316 [Muntiacus reevesi]|uniref:DAZ domain-containing protein n=1 Tax=Muntiacus reevesi TaxID=9886 RepID=A0A5N3XSN5_MUNRE|nr:hypothetical protein FD755_011316 [Muntiacus reevesi]
MPNTLFSWTWLNDEHFCFTRYVSVKQVKIITDRTCMSTESQINFHDKKLKLSSALRKQNLYAYHSVWSNPNTETYRQPLTTMNPITQYVQAYPPYPTSLVQDITGYQLSVYNYQMLPPRPAEEQRRLDPGAEVLPSERSVHEATSSSGNGPQKKSDKRVHHFRSQAVLKSV